MGRLKLFHKAKTPAQLLGERVVELVTHRQWASLNAMLSDALVCGDLQITDLNFNPQQQADEHGKSRLWGAFEAAVRMHNGDSKGKDDTSHKEGVWLLRSWEAAAKADWLSDVLKEMNPNGQKQIAGHAGMPAQERSSLVLRQVYSAMRLFMADVETNPNEMPLSLFAGPLPTQAAHGVARLTFSVAGNMFWPGKFLERCDESSAVSGLDPDNGHVAIRRHLGPRAYLECLDGQNYNDGSPIYWADGTIFFSKEPHQLDAFISKRTSVELFERAMTGANSHPDGLLGILDSGFDPDTPAEHRRSQFRPLHQACYAGNLRTMGILLEKGSNPGRFEHERIGPIFSLIDAIGFHCGDRVSEHDFIACLDELVKHGLDINEPQMITGRTPLMQAAIDCHTWALSALLLHGADPLIKNSQGLDVFEQFHCAEISAQEKPKPQSMAYLQAWRANHAIEQVLTLSKSASCAPQT